MISNDEPNFYMKPYLMNVNNIPELVAFIGFFIISIYMFILVLKDYQIVQSLPLQRKDEQRDMLQIKKWLLINLTIQGVVYLEQIIGYAFRDHQTIAIIFYFLDYQLIVVFYIIYWQSTLIWTQLVIMKTSTCHFASRTTDFLRKYPIVEIVLVFLAAIMFVFYLLKNETQANYNFKGCCIHFSYNNHFDTHFISCNRIIIQKNYIKLVVDFKLNQEKGIKILIQVNQQMIGLIIVITLRLIWNILLVIPSVDDKLQCFKCNDCNCTITKDENLFNWAIYEVIYIPIVNFAPIILLNFIYHPKKFQESKRMLLLDTY